MFQDVYQGKRVLVTGHTGFQGTWLCCWLQRLGAQVTGFALDPPTKPSNFEQTGLSDAITDLRGDVRDLQAVLDLVTTGRFDFIFHLAAQALVLEGYAKPAETFATNVLGTLNVLEAVRRSGWPSVVVAVSADTAYEHRDGEPYREDDKLGGSEPSGASKSAMEIVVSSYRDTFFGRDSHASVATARAGSAIGGGDWQKNRIVPDIIRSLTSKQKTVVRNPQAVRPWQHVLEPLSGYLEVAARLDVASRLNAHGDKELLCTAWNFGPTKKDTVEVGELATRAIAAWAGERRPWIAPPADSTMAPDVAIPQLNIEKARKLLQWAPVWDYGAAIERTMSWYWAVVQDAASARRQTDDDIAAYEQAARNRGLHWATAEAAVHE